MMRGTRLGRRLLCAAVLTLGIIGVAVWWTVSRDVGNGQPDRAMGGEAAVHSGGRDVGSPAVQSEPEADPAASEPTLSRLTPADVMGNPECIMRPGIGGDLALVLVPGDGRLRFAVIDGSGVVFEDTLPELTRFSSLVRQPGGSVLAGFLSRAGPPAGSGGVILYRDGQVIYENRAVTQFALAGDGMSFFVIEPMAGDAARLVIRNLELGTETHHDLGLLKTTSVDVNRSMAAYSIDDSEVVIQSLSLFLGGGTRTEHGAVFFPTNGGEPRELAPLEGATPLRRFASSRVGYFTTLRRDDFASTVKSEFRYDNAEVSAVDRWKRDLAMTAVSDDGVWVVAQDGATIHVLDASTGETVFQRMWPSLPDYRVDILEGRLVLDSPVADPGDLASCRSLRQVESRTVADETDGTTIERRLVDVTEERACLADLRERGLYRTVYDVYDLRTLADGTPPDHYRVEYGENPHCGSGHDPLGTLEVRDDRLVYVPRT